MTTRIPADDLAKLAADSYLPDGRGRATDAPEGQNSSVPHQLGYRLVEAHHDDKFSGMAWQAPAGDLVIVFKGTNPDPTHPAGRQDIEADIDILQGKIPDTAEKAYHWADGIIGDVMDKGGVPSIVLTGHSLGGYYANYTLIREQNKSVPNISAVTWDALGFNLKDPKLDYRPDIPYDATNFYSGADPATNLSVMLGLGFLGKNVALPDGVSSEEVVKACNASLYALAQSILDYLSGDTDASNALLRAAFQLAGNAVILGLKGHDIGPLVDYVQGLTAKYGRKATSVGQLKEDGQATAPKTLLQQIQETPGLSEILTAIMEKAGLVGKALMDLLNALEWNEQQPFQPHWSSHDFEHRERRPPGQDGRQPALPPEHGDPGGASGGGTGAGAAGGAGVGMKPLSAPIPLPAGLFRRDGGSGGGSGTAGEGAAPAGDASTRDGMARSGSEAPQTEGGPQGSGGTLDQDQVRRYARESLRAALAGNYGRAEGILFQAGIALGPEGPQAVSTEAFRLEAALSEKLAAGSPAGSLLAALDSLDVQFGEGPVPVRVGEHRHRYGTITVSPDGHWDLHWDDAALIRLIANWMERERQRPSLDGRRFMSATGL